MRRWNVFLILIALFVLLTIGVGLVAPRYLKGQIESRAGVSIEGLTIDWLHPGHFILSKVHFSFGEKEAVQCSGEADLSVRLSLRAALKKQIHIYHLDLSNFLVRINNGDQHTPPSKSKKRPFTIDNVGLKNGKFEYIRHHENTLATLHVSNINGRIRNIRSDPKAVADGEITARYEKSGATKLTVSAHPFADDPNPDVRLLVHDQDLHDLTDFFDPNAGVLLFGRILDADAHVIVSGNKLHATDAIKYEDLKVRLVSENDRSKTEAFFMTLGTKMTLFSRNTNLKLEGQTNSANLTRENHETLVSFILRGLKESASNVASRKPKTK